MKQIFRLAAMLLAVLMLLAAMPAAASSSATVTAATVTAKPGDTVIVPVSVTKIDDVASIGMHVSYDSTALKCVEAQMSEAVGSMSWANANTEPVGHPNEVWLTAITSNRLTLDGIVLSITFEVLPTAPAGLSPVTILTEGLSISVSANPTEISTTPVSGGVIVEGGATESSVQGTTTTVGNTTTTGDTSTKTPTLVTTTTAQGTTPQTTTGATPSTTLQGGEVNTTATQAATTTATQTEETITRPNGEVIVIPQETMLDMQSQVVTNASGVPTKVRAVAILLDEVTAKPGDTVTVKVTMSAVTDLTVLGIDVGYDTKTLTFQSGECLGSLKESAGMANIVENQIGTVNIVATDNDGIRADGVVAELHFTVKPSARNGDYRLQIKDTVLQKDGVEFPAKTVAGKVTVEGAAEDNSSLYVIIAVIALATVAVVVAAVVLRRRKKGSPAPTEQAPEKPHVTDVSGEEE